MNRDAVRFYAETYREQKMRLLAGTALSILRALLVLPVPILVAVAIDDAIGDRDTARLIGLGIAILALTAASAGVGIASRTVLARATMQSQAHLRQEAVSSLLRMSRRRYTAIDDATLHDHVLQETKRIEQGTNALFQDFLPGSILIVGITLVLLTMSPALTAVTLVFVPVIFLVSRWLGRHVDRAIDRDNQRFERFSNSILMMLRSMDLIRIQAAEKDETDRQATSIEALRATSVKRSVGITVWISTQQSLVAMAGTAVLIIGGIQAINGSMTLGGLIAFYAGFALLRGPLSMLADRTPFLIEGAQSLDRLHDMLHEVEERPYTGTKTVDFTGWVTLESVDFAYEERQVLHSVDLTLDPGRVVGLVGPNGSGKSTIVNLIVGFYRPQSGTVSANGTPYEELDITALRRNIGTVPQQPLLRGATVIENLLYGRRDLTAGDVEAALDIARAREFVEELPQGLDTLVGEDGVFLSGGQRQRLAIARAVIHRPPLLILDEPTNHLDRSTVEAVIDAIRTMPHRPAVLLVSHRTEVLANVDTLVDLEGGRIVSSTRNPSGERTL